MPLTTSYTSLDNNAREDSDKPALSQIIHDLSGPTITARGFAGELEIARDKVLALLEWLPSDTDPDVMQALKDELENEMQHCLFRIEESLSKLDNTIDGMRAG